MVSLNQAAKQLSGNSKKFKTKIGNAGYDNARENVDPHVKTQVVSTQEIGGSPVFTGGGLSFGEIYASDNTTETAIATKDVWVQCTIFSDNGEANNTTPDHAQDHIIIDKAGKYLIIVSASVLSGAGAAFDGEFEVKKNNGTVDLANIHTDRDLVGGGGDHGSISLTGIANLSVNDTIEFWMRNKTNTTNVIVEDITLTLVQIGG